MRLKHKIRNFLTLAGSCLLTYGGIVCLNIFGIKILSSLGLFGQLSTTEDFAKLTFALCFQVPIIVGTGSVGLLVWLLFILSTVIEEWWND